MTFNLSFAALVIILSAMCLKYTALEGSRDEKHWKQYVFSTQAFINLTLVLLTLYSFYYLIPPLLNKFRNPLAFDDFRWFYAASLIAQDGENPYSYETFAKFILPLLEGRSELTPFVYPPSIIPIIFPLSYFAYDTAARIFFCVNLLSIVVLLYGATLLLERKTSSFKMYCLCTCALIFGVTWSVRLGNISTIVSCLIVWTVIFARNDNNALAGILLGVSTLKPTLSLLFMIYFVLKTRFVLLAWSVATCVTLTALGLWITNTDAMEFLSLFRAGTEVFFNDYYNSASTSPTRIDAGVIGPRIFPDDLMLANLVSYAITIIFTISIVFYIYRSQKSSHWSPLINLSEISLLACLSLLPWYSQPQNGSILVLVVVFLLNYLSSEIFPKTSIWNKLVFWYMGALALIIHTRLIYGYILGYSLKHGETDSYVAKIGIASMPSYAILGLTLSVLILAKRHSTTQKTFAHAVV